MKPAKYDIEIYRGDTYYGPVITLPSLTPFGGPSDLVDATVKAQVRASGSNGSLLGEFIVQPVDLAARKFRLILNPSVTQTITEREGVWDLEVVDGAWVGTPLAGIATISGQVTRDE